jgi:hypothetical protein
LIRQQRAGYGIWKVLTMALIAIRS